MRGSALFVGSLLAGLVLGTISGAAVARTADGSDQLPVTPASQPARPGCAPAQPAVTPTLPAPSPAPEPRLAA
ncbi:hypothetical protein OG196_32000 [Kitasatospora purpeofusca]|uniref:hypothetical protein n=1 Tax=Kitasatospora purpeofusca TaxID=67352 RepID=UPI002E0FF0CA|nr:hypothetical protein OG196_32000 [Kitasatospora purpeofusca]